MKRIYYPHSKWEDHQHGLFNMTCPNETAVKARCNQLLANPYMLYAFMKTCCIFWKYSAAQNLSNQNRNRQAWLGQAACCYFAGAPEYVTKLAWRELTSEERIEANKVADQIIKQWEREHGEYSDQISLFPDQA